MLVLLAPTAGAATLDIGFTFPAEGEILSGPLRAEGWVTHDSYENYYIWPDGGPAFPVTLNITPKDLGGTEPGGIYLNHQTFYTSSSNGTWNVSTPGLPLDGLYQFEATATWGNVTAKAQRDIRVRNGLWLEVDSVEALPDFDGQPRALRVVGRAGFAPVAVEVAFSPESPASPDNTSGVRPARFFGLPRLADHVEVTPLDEGYRFVATTSQPEPAGTHWVRPKETSQPPTDRPHRPAEADGMADDGTTSSGGASRPARLGYDPVVDFSMLTGPATNGSVSVQAYRRPPPIPENGTLIIVVASPDGPASLVRTWPEPVLFQTRPGFRTMTMAPCAEGQEPNPVDGTDPCHQSQSFGEPSYTLVEAAPALGAAATAALATLGFAFTESGRYALGLFSRIKGPTVLEQPRREALYAAVRQQPGVRFGQLRRDFALGNGVLAHHLAALEREGLIRRHLRGVHVHFLATGHRFPAGATFSPAGNALLMAAAGGDWHAQADLARRLGLSRQAVHDQVHRLRLDGRLDVDARGRVRARR